MSASGPPRRATTMETGANKFAVETYWHDHWAIPPFLSGANAQFRLSMASPQLITGIETTTADD